jgi:glycerophosphoryl diester phosphodiesterase
VPRVDEVFELVAAHGSAATLIAVDLKETGNGIEEAVVRLAEQRKVLDRLIFIGETIQSADVRSRLRAANPKAPVARLTDAAENIADTVADPNADWVYVRFLPTVEDMRRVHSAGKRVFLAGPLVVGVEVENWTKAANIGVDAILTDYPLELQRQLRQPKR